MKNLPLLLLVIVLISLLNACKKNEMVPAQLITNGDFERQPSFTRSKEDWLFGYYYNLTANPNGYSPAYTSEAAMSGTHSLKISCNTIKNDTTFCFFEQDVNTSTISTGAKLTLKANIKTVNLQGRGVALAMIGYKFNSVRNTIVFFPSTENTPITGTNDFREYSVTLPTFPEGVDLIAVHLFYLPKTTGVVYVDDVSLVVN